MITAQLQIKSKPFIVSAMANNIVLQVDQLDALRHYLFLEWLLNHTHFAGCDQALQENLTTWFHSMSPESAYLEYKLIMGEIRWWMDLDKPHLANIFWESLRNHS